MHLKCKWSESLALSYKIQGAGQEDDGKKGQHPLDDVVGEHHPAELPLARLDALWLVLTNLWKMRSPGLYLSDSAANWHSVWDHVRNKLDIIDMNQVVH